MHVKGERCEKVDLIKETILSELSPNPTAINIRLQTARIR